MPKVKGRVRGGRALRKQEDTGRTRVREEGVPGFPRGPAGLSILFVLYGAGLFLVLPRFNVLFNDEWVYTWIAKNLYETGVLRSTGFEATPVTVQALLGAAACLLGGGFSLHALHAVTFLLSFASATAFYFYLRRLGLDDARSTAGALVLVFNPVFFVNSFTFMSDVQGLSFVVLSLFLLDKGSRERKDLLVFLGVISSVCGYFVRLFGILVAVAFVVWVVVNPTERRRLTLRRILLLFVLPLLSGFTLMRWWTAFHRVAHLPYSVDLVEKSVAYLNVLLTLGFFAVPILIPAFVFPAGGRGRDRRGTLLGVATILSVVLVARGQTFPFLRNQITRWGMYVPYEFIGGVPDPLFPEILLVALTVLSVIATASVLYFISVWFVEVVSDGRSRLGREVSFGEWDSFATRHLSDSRAFLHLFSLLYLASLYFVTVIFDRYLLFLIPSTIILALDSTRPLRFPGKTVAGGLAALLAFSVFLATDALSWNAAVWTEARDLVKNGVAAREIDAGWAWDGYSYLTEPPVPRERLKRFRPVMWYYAMFPGSYDNYVFSFSPWRPGFRLIKDIQYRGLPFRKASFIYLLARTG